MGLLEKLFVSLPDEAEMKQSYRLIDLSRVNRDLGPAESAVLLGESPQTTMALLAWELMCSGKLAVLSFEPLCVRTLGDTRRWPQAHARVAEAVMPDGRFRLKKLKAARDALVRGAEGGCTGGDLDIEECRKFYRTASLERWLDVKSARDLLRESAWLVNDRYFESRALKALDKSKGPDRLELPLWFAAARGALRGSDKFASAMLEAASPDDLQAAWKKKGRGRDKQRERGPSPVSIVDDIVRIIVRLENDLMDTASTVRAVPEKKARYGGVSRGFQKELEKLDRMSRQ